MENILNVEILPRHCTANYMNTFGCPLYKAIKEQYPEFPLGSVAGTYIRTRDGEQHSFDWTIWNSAVHSSICRGERNKLALQIFINS